LSLNIENLPQNIDHSLAIRITDLSEILIMTNGKDTEVFVRFYKPNGNSDYSPGLTSFNQARAGKVRVYPGKRNPNGSYFVYNNKIILPAQNQIALSVMHGGELLIFLAELDDVIEKIDNLNYDKFLQYVRDRFQLRPDSDLMSRSVSLHIPFYDSLTS
jgi:hypothetical protein